MYQTILYKYSNKDDTKKMNKTVFSKLEDTGSIFIFFKNEYNNNQNIRTNLFDIINLFLKLEFKFVNAIVYPDKTSENYFLRNNSNYLLWFVKDDKKMFFNKDEIREKHIWKDVEWGKRERNYNSKGKDPGNIWIPTIDNGKGVIIEHLIMNIEDVVNRCIVSTHKKGFKVFIKIPNIDRNKIKCKDDLVFKVYKNEKTNEKIKEKIYKESRKLKNKEIACNGDIYFSSSEKMSHLEDGSIDLMVTSPPYWDLKNYFKKGQIGQESYLEYLDRINDVWKETFRVLKNNSSAWININIRTKAKTPILIPNDIINQCKKIGFTLKDIIIWHKSSGIPTHKNNIVDRYEFFLWFVKGKQCKINKIEIRDYKNDNLNQGLFWNINRKAGSIGKNYVHPAIYPDKLIDRIISLCSNDQDIILDPFMGSGTTMINAVNNNRNCIGYEYNENFLDLIKYRIKKDLNNKHANIKFYKKNKKNNNEIFRNN